MKYDARLRCLFNKRNPDKKIYKLIAATVNKTEELEYLVKLGVGGIQTDVPHRLRKIAKKYKRLIEEEEIFEKKII